ncbi:MAG: LytTR family transcriptional regulator DNA-binding domain-containing protein [Lachnospiraceae bacterium]|nr:LytTR family transcriptional regulator DNA-binding domain-containing protein [Lachnospiraceae bacterium]
MEVHVLENEKKLQVIIKCKQADEQIDRLKTHIELFDKKLQARTEGDYQFVNAMEVLYFESVDNRVFLYTENKVMEVKQRLYELEEMLSKQDFIRSSKSQIININKIKALKPELNRTILATMCNGEQLYISRKYVKEFRSLLAI